MSFKIVLYVKSTEYNEVQQDIRHELQHNIGNAAEVGYVESVFSMRDLKRERDLVYYIFWGWRKRVPERDCRRKEGSFFFKADVLEVYVGLRKLMCMVEGAEGVTRGSAQLEIRRGEMEVIVVNLREK